MLRFFKLLEIIRATTLHASKMKFQLGPEAWTTYMRTFYNSKRNIFVNAAGY